MQNNNNNKLENGIWVKIQKKQITWNEMNIEKLEHI